MFQQLPTAGLPPQFAEWGQYEAMAADLKRVGVIEDLSELRWDIRPSPRWGTIEVRTFDGIPTMREIGAITALAQCLVEYLSRELDAGREIPQMQPWFVRENKWRAARYGMDAIIIRNAAADERLIAEDLAHLLPVLAPIADALGCAAELQNLWSVLGRGASYQRQLRVAADNGGNLEAVVSSLVRELRDDQPS
jgi:carboxylate-amine ligase